MQVRLVSESEAESFKFEECFGVCFTQQCRNLVVGRHSRCLGAVVYSVLASIGLTSPKKDSRIC